MDISTDVLYDLLSQRYSVDRIGRGAVTNVVTLPTFFDKTTHVERGRTYITRTVDLPDMPAEGCLFICVGSRPPRAWNMWAGEIIHVVDAHDDLMGVFNTVQRILDRLINWEQTMQNLVSSGASMGEMVEASIPIFENRITVTDYEMRVLAFCQLEEADGDRRIVMSSRYDRVPANYTPLFSGRFTQYMRNREPFYVEEKGSADNYCINLFLGDSYVGCCTLKEEANPIRPLRTSDLELFHHFSEFVRQALIVQTRTARGQLVTLKSVFTQLLRCYPVSDSDVARSLRLTALNLNADNLDAYKWCCVVMQSANRGKDLPEGYLCSLVEDALPNALAVSYEDAMVAFCLLKRDDHRISAICDPLEPFLEDMNFRAGISRTFHDVYHARDFYLQARCAINVGTDNDPKRSWYLFGDYVLDYMLDNCCGDFDPDMVIAPELVRLSKLSASGVDYVGTLRAYLDNDCNASQTAKAMFLHRSTLVQRIERIREIVDLELPERRLYLHMCLHLPGVGWDSLENDDVEDFG